MNPELAKLIKRIFNIISILGILATVLGAVYLYRIGALTNQAVLKDLVLAHKILGPFIFVSITMIGIIIPIIPGGLSQAAGVLIFGPVMGFVYNYIGICFGSLGLFYVGRRYGTVLIRTFVKEKTYERFMGIYERSNRRFDWIFFALICSPIAPDDALVMISSQTKMTYKFFIFTIFVGKIPSILAYSYVLIYGGELVKKLIGG
ncbi:TVP38/TMEM64 family protein [Lactovum miscens]|uniref:TVP38/TMEM64 family membrane protein n=1 Tax=Lactovum miscens TaxID=190387 RepID=A0A841C7H0_9LACT|nr:VTT domain-containing protein [Lactovum miscens]MBB5887190.1 putative membrane protein YdjX (TVP38/TMEM64 family) [Lactovum miscens]